MGQKLGSHPLASAVLLAIAVFAGCGERLSEYERDQRKMDVGKDLLVAQGASVELKRTGMGDAWIVSLQGQTLTPETFDNLSTLRRIMELNLSDTNFGDEMVPLINDTTVRDTLVTLNLSGTKLTDHGLEGFTNIYVMSSLNAKNTSVTKQGAKRLKERWPQIKVTVD